MRSVFFIPFMLFCQSVLAQETKPCLFIGRYDKNKTYCSDKEWLHEEVKDRQEYELKRVQFRNAHKADVAMTYPTDFVSAKECVIVYSFQRRNGAFKCDQTFINIITGNSVEHCHTQLAAQIAKNGKGYYLTARYHLYQAGSGKLAKESRHRRFWGCQR